MPEAISLKFPDGTKARLHSLAGSGESMTAVLLRGLDALSQPPAKRDESARLAELVGRIDALEQRLASANVSHEPATQTATGDGRHYSAPERALAITLDRQGKRPVEVRRILQAEFGRAPSASSMRRQLNAWKADLTEPR